MIAIDFYRYRFLSIGNSGKKPIETTKLVVISSKFRNRPNLTYVRVGDEFIAPKLSVRNLGVIIDNWFCMEQHVKKVYSEANISKIRLYLTQDSAQILIHAYVSSKIDYCKIL